MIRAAPVFAAPLALLLAFASANSAAARESVIWPSLTSTQNCARLDPNLTFTLLRHDPEPSDRLVLEGRLLALDLTLGGPSRVLLERGRVCAAPGGLDRLARAVSVREAREAAAETIAALGCAIPVDAIERFEARARARIARRVEIKAGRDGEAAAMAGAILVGGVAALLEDGDLVGDPGRNAFALRRCRP